MATGEIPAHLLFAVNAVSRPHDHRQAHDQIPFVQFKGSQYRQIACSDGQHHAKER